MAPPVSMSVQRWCRQCSIVTNTCGYLHGREADGVLRRQVLRVGPRIRRRIRLHHELLRFLRGFRSFRLPLPPPAAVPLQPLKNHVSGLIRLTTGSELTRFSPTNLQACGPIGAQQGPPLPAHVMPCSNSTGFCALFELN
jgi:hypothetical protein